MNHSRLQSKRRHKTPAQGNTPANIGHANAANKHRQNQAATQHPCTTTSDPSNAIWQHLGQAHINQPQSGCFLAPERTQLAVVIAVCALNQNLRNGIHHVPGNYPAMCHFFLTEAAPAGALPADASSSLPPPGPWLAACSSPGATNMTWLQAASSLPSEAVMRINTSSKLPTWRG